VHWARDQRRKIFENLNEYVRTRPAGVVRLGSVTGRGKGELPWDAEQCKVSSPHKCSGKLGCKVVREAAREWNSTASRRWSDLHRAVYQRVVRKCDLKPRLLLRVIEIQKRGVLHVHPVLAYSTPAERTAADCYFRIMHQLAPRYGFGHTERKRLALPARAAAAYLSAYFVTGKKEKLTLQQSVMHPDMPRSIIHVSVQLTQASGYTMRELRFRRFIWKVAGNWVAIGYYDVARALATYWRDNGYPARGEELIAIIRANEPPDA
jgi:hypothetical protein